MASELQAEAARGSATFGGEPMSVIVARCFAWCSVYALFVFLLNNYLDFWRDWPGAFDVFEGSRDPFAWMQAALYALGLVLAVLLVRRTSGRPLRTDAASIYAITAFIVRASFWAVLLIGIADTVVSFLRVENMLPDLVGDKVAIDLGRSYFRGVWVHFPMAVLALVIASFNRGLGFHWLALLVVVAELLIVISRFIFSYEQAFMADLVRFWYAALFLFASAYTLLEEGHVRVDVLYAAFTERTKGIANAIGCILLGMTLCWVVIVFGMGSKSAVINAPLLAFEVTQTGFGSYVKYWMAGFLGIFAITMLLQFSGYFLESIADYRGEPGKRQLETDPAQMAHEH
jgi:TRAP-type mannitol/chloroaromatic compound transport system permease small subunit